MKRLDPDKLHVAFRDGATLAEPLAGRTYTLTHSDRTGELLLVIGRSVAADTIGPMRDEVVAAWAQASGGWILCAVVQVDLPDGSAETSRLRDAIFRKELPLAMEAMRYGDRALTQLHPELDDGLVMLRYCSRFPELAAVESAGRWGDFR